jgi:hypothetical protein
MRRLGKGKRRERHIFEGEQKEYTNRNNQSGDKVKCRARASGAE